MKNLYRNMPVLAFLLSSAGIGAHQQQVITGHGATTDADGKHVTCLVIKERELNQI